jgi:hypothetical protein
MISDIIKIKIKVKISLKFNNIAIEYMKMYSKLIQVSDNFK